MDYGAIITQLKANAPALGGRVAGFVEFTANAAGEMRPETFPAAYVIPLGADATDNDISGMGLYQVMTERVAVVVEFSNVADRRGQGVTELLDGMQRSIFSAILNWRGLDPDHAVRGLELVSHSLARDADRGRVFWQWEFKLDLLLTELDGWRVPLPPLVEITANDPETYPTADPPPFSVTLD